MEISLKNKIAVFILAILFLAAVFVWSIIWQNNFSSISGNLIQGKLKVIFFDVGQGSATFIESPNKNQVLIDGGPGSQILEKLGAELLFFDRTIDAIILTHPDADHLNGLVDVLRKYEVEQVIEPCLDDSSGAYQEWLKIIIDKKIKRVCGQFGQRIKLSKDAFIDILYPFNNLVEAKVSNTNSASLVMALRYYNNSILLTGDAEKATEYQLINSDIDLQTQVLQIGHHGSKSSSGEEFLSVVNPEIVVIQVGVNNRYGHPHQEVLEKIKAIGAEIFRTDLDGDIEFLCDNAGCIKQ